MATKTNNQDRGLGSPQARGLALGLLLATMSYMAAYALKLPILRYLPVSGSVTLSPPPGSVSMGYYGLLLYGLCGFALGYGLGRFGVLASPLARRGPARLLTHAIVICQLLCLAYVVIHELGRWSGS